MTFRLRDSFKHPDGHVQRLWVHTVASSVHMQDVFVSSGMKGRSVRRCFSTYSLLSPNCLWSPFRGYRCHTHNTHTLDVVHEHKASGTAVNNVSDYILFLHAVLLHIRISYIKMHYTYIIIMFVAVMAHWGAVCQLFRAVSAAVESKAWHYALLSNTLAIAKYREVIGWLVIEHTAVQRPWWVFLWNIWNKKCNM